MDVDQVLATTVVVAGLLKTLTSCMKDIHDMKHATKKKKRRSPGKKKRRN